MSGALEILNVGLGDLKLTFNPHSSAEREHARRMIEDLLRQGYAIVVEGADGRYVRARGFDPETDCYIISEAPSASTEPTPDEGQPKKTRGRPRKVQVPRTEVKATAIARSAGG